MGAVGGKEKLIAYRAVSSNPNTKKVWELEVGELLTNGWETGPRTTPTVSTWESAPLWGKGVALCRCKNWGKIWDVHMVNNLMVKFLVGGTPSRIGR